MVDAIGIGLVIIGIILLFGGATLSVYSVGLLGLLVGGGAGYMIAPTIGSLIGVQGILAIIVAATIGGLIGVVATYALLSVAIAVVSFIVGGFLGLVALAPILIDGPWFLDWGVALGVGIVAAFLGLIMTKSTMVLLTSFLGAAITSRTITLTNLETAQTTLSIDPLIFEVTGPLFLGLFFLGVLTQFGLFKFGYVTKLVTLLPGATIFTDRGRGSSD